jgi:hypothetical protein
VNPGRRLFDSCCDLVNAGDESPAYRSGMGSRRHAGVSPTMKARAQAAGNDRMHVMGGIFIDEKDAETA